MSHPSKMVVFTHSGPVSQGRPSATQKAQPISKPRAKERICVIRAVLTRTMYVRLTKG